MRKKKKLVAHKKKIFTIIINIYEIIYQILWNVKTKTTINNISQNSQTLQQKNILEIYRKMILINSAKCLLCILNKNKMISEKVKLLDH